MNTLGILFVLKLIDITEDNLPYIGDLITDPEDGAIGIIYDINPKNYMVYWTCVKNEPFDTKETDHSLTGLKLIPT